MRRHLKSLLCAVIITATGNAQSRFTLGLSESLNSSPYFGDSNIDTVELRARPGQTVYLWFQAQFQPGHNGAIEWAILNAFMDLERQYGNYSDALTFVGFDCRGCRPSHYGRIRANSITPAEEPTPQFPLVTNDGVTGKIMVAGGRRETEPFIFARADLRIEPDACPRRYELCMTRIAGLDNYEQGAIIGVEGVTVRTNFGVRNSLGQIFYDYGQRICVTLEVVRAINGDVNYDGCVDDADLMRILSALGNTGCLQEDLNGDQIVDDADLLIVLSNVSDC